MTTLIDFYALPANFPGFEEGQKIVDKNERLTFLEKAIIEDIQGEGYLPHLHPYIQLHEFEAFTFAGLHGFRNYFSETEADFNGLREIIDRFENPEDINEHMATAPSKRLKNLIPGYNKITDGNSIISTNGIELIIEKCPRFRQWIEAIIEKMINE